ncbi:hypothetical protein M422DRAFT_242103 [Sphaerobolus stellatus SS14]|nr:hypothetical protein M422DRAFT_242103 [Sphaerobolus stellatus SS14]
MAPKRKPLDKVPAGTSDAVDSGNTPHVIGGNDPTLDPGKDPSQEVSAASETNTLHPMTQNYSEPSERSALADPDPKELALGDQIQEMLDTINEHMHEVTSIHNMSCQAAQLLAKTNESNIRIREKYPTIAKGKLSIRPRDPHKDPNNEDLGPQPERPSNWLNVDEESTSDQPNVDPELIQSTGGPNNRSNPKQALGRARTELLAKTAVLEWLYVDQAPADHLNQAATAARSTRMEYQQLLRLSKAGLLNPQDRSQLIQPSEDTRETLIRDNPHKSVRYAPFNGIEDNDTDSETTVRNHQEGSVPFQQLDDRDILDMSNSESDNTLIRMVKYMLDQNIQTTMEKSPLAKAGVKVDVKPRA